MRGERIKLHENVPDHGLLKKWFTMKGDLLVQDYLMTERGDDKEVLVLFTKHSHHCIITVTYYFQNESECFIGVSKHRETNETVVCFYCFEVFGYPR